MAQATSDVQASGLKIGSSVDFDAPYAVHNSLEKDVVVSFDGRDVSIKAGETKYYAYKIARHIAEYIVKNIDDYLKIAGDPIQIETRIHSFLQKVGEEISTPKETLIETLEKVEAETKKSKK